MSSTKFSGTTDPIWERIRSEATEHAGEEPILASFLHATILNHAELELALSFHLASQLDSSTASSLLLRDVILEAFNGDPEIRNAVRADLQAVEERDSACHELYIPFLYFKGFHALQTYRVAHWLWSKGRHWRCFSTTAWRRNSAWTYTRRRAWGTAVCCITPPAW